MRYGMPAVDECERGAASAAGMIAMIGAGAIQTPCGRPMAANVDKFPRSGRKPLRGAFIRPLGANAVHGVVNDLQVVDADKFPCSGRKPSTGGVDGEWWPAWTKFSMSGTKAA